MKDKNIYDSKIVIVENCKDITECFSTLLKFENFSNIDTFNNPKDALDFLKQNEPDLIIADLAMPGMNGLDFFEKVNKQYPKVPEILIGAYITEENLIRAINEIGIYKYVEKPWDNDVLIEYVKSGIVKE